MKYKDIPIQDIVIYKHPLIYLGLVLSLLVDLLVWIKNFSIKRFPIIALMIIIFLAINYVEAMHSLKIFLIFAAYWVLLGIASSIGLGTGLHTFVLYLGPHIAKIATVATSCGSIPDMLPNRWEFDHFGKCEESNQTIGFFGILLAVQLESFLWGLGTSIGQLPPYFVAKKAADVNEELRSLEKRQQKKMNTNGSQQSQKLITGPAQIQEINLLRDKKDKTFMDKAKIFLYNNLQKYGFITILLGASIPNPLFDLAGITCGHFRVPFKKFFLATFIGKAIIKVHIQMLFVILVFRKETIDALIRWMLKINEGFATLFQNIVIKQRQSFHHPSTSDQKGLIPKLWDVFIILMVGYFLLSIVTSEVQEIAVKRKDKQP